jgi:hypothetical protein
MDALDSQLRSLSSATANAPARVRRLDGSESNARSIHTAYVHGLYGGGQMRRPQCIRGEIRKKC